MFTEFHRRRARLCGATYFTQGRTQQRHRVAHIISTDPALRVAQMNKDVEPVRALNESETIPETPSEALYTALSRNDLNGVIRILREAGPGNWGKILPKKEMATVIGKYKLRLKADETE